jgi:hypothetical protein
VPLLDSVVLAERRKGAAQVSGKCRQLVGGCGVEYFQVDGPVAVNYSVSQPGGWLTTASGDSTARIWDAEERGGTSRVTMVRANGRLRGCVWPSSGEHAGLARYGGR